MKKKQNLYKVTIKKIDEEAQEYIYGAETNEEIIQKFLGTMTDIVGNNIKKVKFFKWEIEN